MRASGVALSACALLVAAAPALGQEPAPPKPPAAEGKRGGVFRAPAPDPPTLDPHLNATFSTHVYASLVYSGLVRFPAGPEIRAAGDAQMAMGPFGAGVTEIDELLYETFFSASPSYLPMWPRYITYPSYVKGFRNQDGASLGSRLLSTWFDR